MFISHIAKIISETYHWMVRIIMLKPDNKVPKHIPVLLEEVIHYLEPRSGGIYLDCTLGLGGHAQAILASSSPSGRLIGLDLDADAIAIAQENLNQYGDRITLVHGNFAHLNKILAQLGIAGVDGILMDVGASSLQFATPERGFSFTLSGPLDMRMDRTGTSTAARVLNQKSGEELAEIFFAFGEERWAKRIAARIVEERRKDAITDTVRLAKIVARAVPVKPRRIHPATRVFQALRIYVNRELENLEAGLKNAVKVLNERGKICVISFHSLEDRMVKRYFNLQSRKCICPPSMPECVCNHKPSLQVLTKRPVVPQSEEIEQNPRARSAKLRAAVAIQNKIPERR